MSTKVNRCMHYITLNFLTMKQCSRSKDSYQKPGQNNKVLFSSSLNALFHSTFLVSESEHGDCICAR